MKIQPNIYYAYSKKLRRMKSNRDSDAVNRGYNRAGICPIKKIFTECLFYFQRSMS